MKRNGILGGPVAVDSGGTGGIEATSAKKSSMAGGADRRAGDSVSRWSENCRVSQPITDWGAQANLPAVSTHFEKVSGRLLTLVCGAGTARYCCTHELRLYAVQKKSSGPRHLWKVRGRRS
jgi:hypothetical protein